LNRIDDIVIFHALTLSELERIVDIQLGFVRGRLAERNMTLVVSQGAKQWLAQRGFDPVFGARPLKRVIQRELLDKLAKRILVGEIRDGEAVNVDVAPDDSLLIRGSLSSAEVVA
jgi:ATP-dependent Clp protease ATP-binding subunit ClpB